MKLMELLHALKAENKEGLVNVDDWRMPDVDHLLTMGFDFVDDYRLRTNQDPEITIYKKKEENEIDETTNKKSTYFYIEEPKKDKKRFKTFADVIDYFDRYSQPEIDEKM